MKEDFLQYLWKFQLFDRTALKTTKQEVLQIVHPGIHNRDTGPDFFNAKIRISGQLWAGNVEIHLKSSDWYLHRHEVDEKYDAVILHVVWEDDSDIFMKNNQELPPLVLNGIVSGALLRNYQKLTRTQEQWIPCESQIKEIDLFTWNSWMERLFVERLERKSKLIEGLLESSYNNWDAVLFMLLAKNFGLNKNGDAFLQLAQSISFSDLRKVAHDGESLQALLFGQAGFLQGHFDENYPNRLKQEYTYLKKKLGLKPMRNNQFQFFRMRPSNFPTVRLAQLGSLYSKSQNLFASLLQCKSALDFYIIFDIEVDEFWKTHYTLLKKSNRTHKKLTRSFIHLLIINTIIPLQFAYQKATGQRNVHGLMALLESIPPEKNTITTKFKTLGVGVHHAFDSQSLIELKNNYCDKKQCLRCAVGNQLLKS